MLQRYNIHIYHTQISSFFFLFCLNNLTFLFFYTFSLHYDTRSMFYYIKCAFMHILNKSYLRRIKTQHEA